MGAILRLRKMPERCNECPFADKEVEYCRVRDSEIIAGKERNIRMPLCPLENEGKYLSNIINQIIRVRNIRLMIECKGKR